MHNWVVGGNRVGAGQMAAILTEAGPLDPGAGKLYQNGTTKDTLCGVGTNNVVAAGTGRTPYEFQISPQRAPATNSAVGINSGGAGTQGTGITKGDDGVPHFVGNGQPDGQFYACNLTLFGPEPMQALYWRDASSKTPSGCAEVKLVPQCAGNLDNSTLYTQDLVLAPCLDDAVNIDNPIASDNANGDGQVQIPFGGFPRRS